MNTKTCKQTGVLAGVFSFAQSSSHFQFSSIIISKGFFSTKICERKETLRINTDINEHLYSLKLIYIFKSLRMNDKLISNKRIRIRY